MIQQSQFGYISKRTESIAALFIIATSGSDPNVHWWMNDQNMSHTCNEILALERKEILSHTTTLMNLEDIILNEISQSQERQTLCYSTKVVKFTENRNVVIRGWREEEKGVVV